MNGDKAYIIGFGTLALGMFLGSLWSPDYQEFCSNGNNFLGLVIFAVCVLIMISLVDYYYEKKVRNSEGSGSA